MEGKGLKHSCVYFKFPLAPCFVNPLHPNISMHILHTDKENFSKNQELYKLMVISLILVALMFD